MVTVSAARLDDARIHGSVKLIQIDNDVDYLNRHKLFGKTYCTVSFIAEARSDVVFRSGDKNIKSRISLL